MHQRHLHESTACEALVDGFGKMHIEDHLSGYCSIGVDLGSVGIPNSLHAIGHIVGCVAIDLVAEEDPWVLADAWLQLWP